MISLIINTAAGAPHAKHVQSSGRVPYSWRAYALQNFIIPNYLSDPAIDELIVVGHWHADAGYTYIPTEPVHYNWADCIAQRQAGFEAARGDILIFQHDDHLLDSLTEDFPGDRIYSAFADCPSAESDFPSVISCSRYTCARRARGEALNDGSANGYIDGHCAIYQREVIERCPWKDVPAVFTMDVAHTQQILAAGFTIAYNTGIAVRDVEYGAEPWH